MRAAPITLIDTNQNLASRNGKLPPAPAGRRAAEPSMGRIIITIIHSAEAGHWGWHLGGRPRLYHVAASESGSPAASANQPNV